MLLADFLKTVPHLTPQQKVDAARDYAPLPYLWRAEGSVRKTQIETGFIINDTRKRLKSLVENPLEPSEKRSLATKVLDAADKLWYPEFYLNLADPEVALLFSASHALGVLNTDEVARITAACMYIPEKPFPNVTLHDVLITLGECPRKAVTASGSWLTVTTTADCPLHIPQVWAQNSRTGAMQRINSLYGPDGKGVSVAGVYDCRIPNEWLSSSLYVDDAYGVM